VKISPSTRPRVSGREEFNRAVPLMRRVASAIAPKRALVEVCLVGSRTMAALNRTYRHRRGVSEILTFSYRDDPSAGLGSEGAVGEVVFCWPAIESAARKRGVPAAAFLLRLLVHGLLHLKGYRHDDAGSVRAMERVERRFLRGYLDESVVTELFA
jgi:probable rRNA maturation factor